MGKRIAFDCPLDPGLGVRGERDVHVAIDGPDGRRCRSDIVKVNSFLEMALFRFCYYSMQLDVKEMQGDTSAW